MSEWRQEAETLARDLTEDDHEMERRIDAL